MDILAEQLCETGRIMFARRLTDLAGGNISARDGDFIYMSPRYAGQRYHWNLTPDLLVTGRYQSDAITEQANFSREGWVHLLIYRNFPDVKAVIHAHPFHLMPFAAFGWPVEPVLEATQIYGRVELCKPAPPHTLELAESIVAALREKEEVMRQIAAAVLMPTHGIILAGIDLENTLTALESLEINAYCLSMLK